MACNPQTSLPLTLILLITLCLFPSTSLSDSLEEMDYDYKKWLSWNVQDYKRQDFRQSSIAGPRSLDLKLMKAEAAQVSYNVSQDGDGNFKSIKEAINSIQEHNTRRVILVIRPGVYREKIVIPKSMPFITFLGSGNSRPIITWNDTAATSGGTFHSATVAVNSDYFVAANITFKNSAPNPEPGQEGAQAVALRISGNKAAFYNCNFHGAQDTLYDHKGLHYFYKCNITGTVDFVFGYGRSLYEDCSLNSTSKKVSALTAQKRTNKTLESGFSFINTTVTGSGLLYLGRAWGDHSRVIFSYTYMDKVVIPEGWNSWNIKHPEKSGIYYGEYQCSGPGANFTGRVNWSRILTDDEARPFLGTYYIRGDNWILDPPSSKIFL